MDRMDGLVRDHGIGWNGVIMDVPVVAREKARDTREE